MKIRVVDYVANPGGGIRYVTELLRALRDEHADLVIEFVSFGSALERYEHALKRRDLGVSFHAVRPFRSWTRLPATRAWGIPGTGRLKWLLGYRSRWHYASQASMLSGCDAVWFPWIRQHRIPRVVRGHVVGTVHDAIIFQWPGLLPDDVLRDEQMTMRMWLASRAQIVVGSTTTRSIIAEMFGVSDGRLSVIPPGWDHVHHPPQDRINVTWPWSRGRYVLCPANTSPHKNHEVLLQGIAMWNGRIPVVLTGYGADLLPEDRRGQHLRQFAAMCGLQLDHAIVPLGYVSDDEYFHLVARAWAVIMPSLLEGGGSFPVMEAMVRGVPVICSDIPVMREQLAATGGEVLWFDPRNPADLAERLRELEGSYEHYRSLAQGQAGALHVPNWREAAQAYWTLMTSRSNRG